MYSKASLDLMLFQEIQNALLTSLHSFLPYMRIQEEVVLESVLFVVSLVVLWKKQLVELVRQRLSFSRNHQ